VDNLIWKVVGKFCIFAAIMTNKTYFNPQHFSKELKKKFTKGINHLQLNDVFEKDGKRYQYIGKDDSGNIVALVLNDKK